MVANPFKPTAGATPPLLIGRRALLTAFGEGLDDGPGAPARLSIFTGARGVGKTVMLTEASSEARRRSWVVIDETASTGVVDRIRAAVAGQRSKLDFAPPPRRPITSVQVDGLGGMTWAEPPTTGTLTLREEVEGLLDLLAPHGTGLLITVDEVHARARGDLRELAATFQHLVRDQREVALALAGLPKAVSDLLSDDVLTFMRRADQHLLLDVPIGEVRAALEETFTSNGRDISDAALDVAAGATGGYPFMVQLVGYHVWRQPGAGPVDVDRARAGVEAARVRLGATVHEANLADLSDVDRTYLIAMAQDDGPSSTADVARRLGRGKNYGSVYRARLIAAGVIRPVGQGHVDFAVPYLREHLRDHAAQHEMQQRLP